MSKGQEILEVSNVFKVFGDSPDKAMEMLHKGATKEQVLSETGQNVGVFDASFTVKRGEIFVIMGLSGSGKSTLVRLLNRLIEPSSGSIKLKGQTITNLKDKDLLNVRRRDMSMVFQSFALMPHMSVIDNAAFGLEVSGVDKKTRHERAIEALDQVGLANYASSRPDQLSGGMQQRVGLARALANDPTILLMDEAFSALDPLIRYEMQGELIRLQKEQERTIVFISHDLDEAIRIGDRIAIMEGGRIVQIGTPDEIMNNPADDYVASFFKGVDSAKTIKIRDIATSDAMTWSKSYDAASQASDAQQEFVYLLDDDQKFLGVVPIGSVEDWSLESLKGKCLPNQFTLNGSTSLKESISMVSESPYPVPVLDDRGVYKGILSKDTVLASLANN
ncbi:glycine betaine/L-proline ABC transporter ATP-binding protein ProV [Marinomonas ostreistagni]|uniref:Quaternary amine transport ATP-binding protein n=1 Tax=Marinomonas ostreistagni TaxID=359209 RepID=A0ABS0ZF86_9GAMM|nr:glycine betaine/L-proline ABC transporter ATP-binding protein ProV [Marinomonas ostreistagni]MBJ7552347.1 glycine betaine/L-proline ABC transporter ATP-binding protein ProV [Marinomonas ostreistagni]